MQDSSRDTIAFQQGRFRTRLPTDCLYTPSHFWLLETDAGEWRVGLTSFATRMLGEIVEFDFEVESGAEVGVGDLLGWIEGFKAVSDLYCVAEGRFTGSNPSVGEACERICRDPFGEGWLYCIHGRPDPRATDVHGYIAHLERTIATQQAKPWQTPDRGEM